MTSLCPVMSAEVSSSSAGLGKGCSWLMARWCSYSLPCPRQYQDSPVRWFHNPRLGRAMLRAIMLTEPWTTVGLCPRVQAAASCPYGAPITELRACSVHDVNFVATLACLMHCAHCCAPLDKHLWPPYVQLAWG